jgi:hypothetical protein
MILEYLTFGLRYIYIWKHASQLLRDSIFQELHAWTPVTFFYFLILFPAKVLGHIWSP